MEHIDILIDLAPAIGGLLTITAAILNTATAIVTRRRQRNRPAPPTASPVQAEASSRPMTDIQQAEKHTP